MRRRRPHSVALACLAAAVSILAGGCQKEHEEGEAVREGLDVKVDGVDFNVGITRQLNLRDPEDRAYYPGPEAPPGSALYGVFLEACNHGKRSARAANDFTVVDTQGNTFEPRPLPAGNLFAYRPRVLGAGDCIPERGSIPATAPAQGALLVFQLPLTSTENRPLELDIEGTSVTEEGKTSEGKVDLDI